MAKTIAALTDLDTVEVSLVQRGANRKKFALAKKEGTSVEEIVKVCLETECAEEARIIKSESKHVDTALRAAVRALAAFKDELPEGAVTALSALTGENRVSDKVEKKEAAKDPEVEAQFQAILKEHEVQKEAIKKAEEKNRELETLLKAERDDRRKREYLAKAEKLDRLPGTAEENGEILRKVADLDPELGSALETKLAAVNAQIGQGALFKSLGQSGPTPPERPAWDEAQKQAVEIAKRDGVTKQQAFARLIETDDALRRRIQDELAAGRN